MPKQPVANRILSHSDICKIILAIILPPVGVFLERGCGADFFINILLTILGMLIHLPHAFLLLTAATRLPARYHPRSVHHSEVLSWLRQALLDISAGHVRRSTKLDAA
ncbi:Plasma membrane proteolipid 3 [Paramyrothecium foliicola]|nr:Plasma membrane proteolipid 3 [Paramyrothecium foliicola]